MPHEGPRCPSARLPTTHLHRSEQGLAAWKPAAHARPQLRLEQHALKALQGSWLERLAALKALQGFWRVGVLGLQLPWTLQAW